MARPPQHRISADAIVLQGERLLLVRHVVAGRYDFWVCPGGGVIRLPLRAMEVW